MPFAAIWMDLKIIIWRRQWHPTPVLLPGKSHGWRSLVGCSPWGRWESDTTERLHFHFSLSCTGEGNGNPLQCSCLENPRDGGAWWAAVYGVAQSQTRLKWLCSSSSRGYFEIGNDPVTDTKTYWRQAPSYLGKNFLLPGCLNSLPGWKVTRGKLWSSIMGSMSPGKQDFMFL